MFQHPPPPGFTGFTFDPVLGPGDSFERFVELKVTVQYSCVIQNCALSRPVPTGMSLLSAVARNIVCLDALSPCNCWEVSPVPNSTSGTLYS
jgi:hypothetical protein